MAEADKIAAHELVLWVDNDADLYRQQYEPIIRNLMTKRARGMYDHDKAVKLFGYLTENGARRYDTGESGRFVTDERGYHYKQNPISPAFNAATRKLAAEELTDAFEAEANTGNYDSLLPKKYRKLPIEIRPVAGTADEDWFEVRGGPPDDNNTFLTYSHGEARAVAADREKKAKALGYTVVHVGAYRRTKNGRRESVTDHERRQLVRVDTAPEMAALRRRRSP